MADTYKLYSVLSGLHSTDKNLFNRLSGHQADEFLHITSAETSYAAADLGRVVRRDDDLFLVVSKSSSYVEEKVIDDSEFASLENISETLNAAINNN